MLTIAACLEHTHTVHIFCDDTSLLEKARERLSIDLSKSVMVPNIFRKGSFRRVLETQSYDVLVVLSDGSIPLSLAKRTIIHFQQPFIQVNGRSLLNKLKLSSVYSVVCNSTFTKSFIDRTYGVRSKVLYPPVATSFFTGTRKKKKQIVSVGRFHPVKKHEVMVNVFNTLKKNMPGWKLYIVGGLLEQDAAYFHSLEKLVTSDIVLLPNAPFGSLQELYRDSMLYWHAAGFGQDPIKHPERMEHFGIAPVEAMGAGCVPLLYNGGGLPEIITHGIEGFLWKTETELSDLTLGVSADKKQLEDMGKRAEKRSVAFDVQTFCQEIQSLVS